MSEKFKFDEMNSIPYWKEVRRLLSNQLGYKKLIPSHFLTFSANFERKGGVNCRKPDPIFDAWCFVLGKKRVGFDAKLFLQKYPTTKEQIYKLRKKMNMIVDKKLY